MADFVWTEDLALGIATLDAQHKQFLRILSRLREALASEREENMLRVALEDLKRYSVYHFAAEEAFMRSRDCPKLAAHQAEHQEFARRVREFDDERLAGARSLAAGLAEYLSAWLVKHIQSTDKAMASCLADPRPD